MGGACGTCGGEDECKQSFGWGNVKERDHLEDPGVDVRIIFKEILKTEWEGVEWIRLVPDRDKWQAVVAMATKIRVFSKAGSFLTI